MTRTLLLAMACSALLVVSCQPIAAPAQTEPTTTPEVYIPLDKAIPDYGIMLGGVPLQIAATTLSGEFPAGCTGAAPACTQPKPGSRFLSVTLAPRDLPEGNMLPYKELPAVSVAMEGGTAVPFSLTQYNHANDNLALGFEVPVAATVFGLKWADLAEIPLRADTQQ